jgi:ABC-type tungstate transport system substrate-binding protein
MDPARELGKWLMLGGLILAAIGGLFLLGGRLPFRLGRLPGDIAIEGKRGSFYFPVVTCIVLSVALTLVMWLVSLLRK